MLSELRICDLGVIAELDLVLGPGMTAVTGETGAGKTMLVEAIGLLVGERADAVLVRTGAEEARVEGRFVVGDDEVVLTRVVPRSGRSRAYVNGRMAPVSALAEAGAALVDLHGQHAHQSRLGAGAQRQALDAFGAVDLESLHRARRRVADLEAALDAVGGDARARAREVDLLRFQVGELDDAALSDPSEDATLAAEEALLADAAAHREAAMHAHHALAGEGGAHDGIGAALQALAGRTPLDDLAHRLRALAAETTDAAGELRAVAERLEDDPEQLAAVRGRRQQLRDLMRKYGATLNDVMAYGEEARRRLEDLESAESRAVTLQSELETARGDVVAAEHTVRSARSAAAPRLAEQVQAQLRQLAMPHALFIVEVGENGAGETVAFLLTANQGEPPLPLAKVASGGELARTMLAARLVLRDLGGPSPATAVFDEVDAGVGGEAALAVGRALATIARPATQVLAVTHLPQVAAFADHQIAVSKSEVGGRTVASADWLDPSARVVELSRMLSGQPESTTARDHAEELLAVAARARRRGT